jgi:hypothetical protein
VDQLFVQCVSNTRTDAGQKRDNSERFMGFHDFVHALVRKPPLTPITFPHSPIYSITLCFSALHESEWYDMAALTHRDTHLRTPEPQCRLQLGRCN